MADRGRLIVDELKRCGVEYIVWLPDSETRFINAAMESDPAIHVIQCCSEGEALAIVAGLHMGGKGAVVLIENNGLFDSGNALRWVADSEFPLVLLVGFISYHHMTETPEGRIWSDDYWPGVRDLTEPFIKAFDLPYHLIDSDEDTKLIGEAFVQAKSRSGPVVILLTSADGYVAGT
ncbi:MAG: hypothetical protein CL908_22615 [Deltaproteobacteria bacterium]|nr:hypothetical protein [Deltaproteobacteria bacterium]